MLSIQYYIIVYSIYSSAVKYSNLNVEECDVQLSLKYRPMKQSSSNCRNKLCSVFPNCTREQNLTRETCNMQGDPQIVWRE